MAQRFGGKYSPGAAGQPPGSTDAGAPSVFDGQLPSRVGAKSNLMFALAVPFLFKAFTGSPGNLILNLMAAFLMLAAAWLTREGLKAHDAYDARKVAKRPAFPRKLFAAMLAGAALVTATQTWSGPHISIIPVAFGVLAGCLHLVAFGLDPMRDKGMEGVDAFQTERVARAVDEAETLLAAMKDAILRAGDPTMEARVERFAAVARKLFRQVEGDPGDLTAARKYLSVYLMGARDATAKFADVFKTSRSPQARADYEALLADLETNFAARTTALLSNNHTDLDVEIKVLRDRLKMNM